MELNAEQIKKALECCISGDDCTMCPLRDEQSCPCVLNENALALITSYEQRIKKLNDKNEGLKAENELLLNMQVVDKHSAKSMRIKLNLPAPLKSSGEEYVVNRQETIKQLIQKIKELTEQRDRCELTILECENEIKRLSEENERLRGENDELCDNIACLEIDLENARAVTVRKMQEQLKMEIGQFGKEGCSVSKEVIFWFIDQIAKEMLEANNERT